MTELLRPLALVLLFAAVMLGAEWVVTWLHGRSAGHKAINKRLALLADGMSRQEVAHRLRADGFKPLLPSPLDRVERRFGRMLQSAGLPYQPLAIAAAMAVAALLLMAFGILKLVVDERPMTAGAMIMLSLFVLVVTVVLPVVVIHRISESRRKKIESQFPVALDIFVRGLRAGHPIAAAMQLLTTEMSDPIGSEFGAVIDEVTYGAELNDALQNMAGRWDLADLRMFVVCLSVQSETGGNLAEILGNLAAVIRERTTMYMKVRALSSEGRMTAVMLTALPVLAFAFLFVVNPGFYMDVAGDPAFIPGFLVLILLYFVGFFSIRRMINLEI